LPGPEVHVYIDKLFLGKSYWKIHREMDKPIKFLGRRHRLLFHDPVSAMAIASRLYPGDPRARRAALLHITFDDICSRDPEFRKLLEIMARLSGRKKRKRKRKRA